MIESIDHGRIRELRLARPPANAFNVPQILELTRRVTSAPGEGADAIVISGAPGMFTGGLDVPELGMPGYAGEESLHEDDMITSEVAVILPSALRES